jgi:hypothetical protein
MYYPGGGGDMIDRPLGRDLNRLELRHVVAGLAERPELWSRHVRHDPQERIYEQIHRDEHLAIRLICWMHDHDTGFHDHDLSAGAVAVVDGQVREDGLAIARNPTTRTLGAWRGVRLPRLGHPPRPARGGSSGGHDPRAYSPPLWRMGAYEIGDQGELRRHSVSYAEELRPIVT